MGRKKRAGRMQISSKILYNAVKRISPNFPILKEARREVMEDQMDIINAKKVIDGIVDLQIEVVEKKLDMPSPFAFGLIMAGYSDIVRVEDKQEFLKRMHQQVLAKINLKKGKEKIKFSYEKFWDESRQKELDEKDEAKEKLKMQVWGLKHVPLYEKEELVKLIENGSCRKDVLKDLGKLPEELEKLTKTFI